MRACVSVCVCEGMGSELGPSPLSGVPRGFIRGPCPVSPRPRCLACADPEPGHTPKAISRFIA